MFGTGYLFERLYLCQHTVVHCVLSLEHTAALHDFSFSEFIVVAILYTFSDKIDSCIK